MSRAAWDFDITRLTTLFAEEWLETFGYRIAIHHQLNNAPLTKETFEHSLAETFAATGTPATLMPNNCVEGDVKVGAERWSLKTQANKGIRLEFLDISKFMEAGQGSLNSMVERRNLVASFVQHTYKYDRLIMLRCFPKNANYIFPEYELVEIPLSLLRKATDWPVEVSSKSQKHPAPFSVKVREKGTQSLAYTLYFDGGSERKVQIRGLRKELCRIHARWEFPKSKSPAT